PIWSPGGQEIIFLRLRLTPEDIKTNLMRVPSVGGESTVLLGDADEVPAVCYSPEGDKLALWSKPGLEVMTLRDSRREVILPRGKLPGRIYQGGGAGGVAWTRTKGKIAIALVNELTKESELWMVGSDGGGTEKVYSMPVADGSITVACYIRNR